MRSSWSGRGAPFLLLALACARLPEQTVEEFFTICMANHGHQVEGVEIHFDETGFADGYSYTEVEVQGDPSPDGHLCLDGVQERYGRE